MYNVYLIQPNYDWGPENKTEYYIPYSAGLLWSYAAQFDEIKNNFHLKEIIFKRENINTVVERIENPSILAFSCYMWNWEYNKLLASKIKEKFPECKIIFGGPSVTDKPFEKLFFQKHRYVDSIVNGEGEHAFKDILDCYLRGDPLKKVYTQVRIDDLNLIPSPYLTGVFDDIVKNNPEVTWQFLLETNRGCPFACTFCDWGGTTYGKVKKFDLDRIIAEVKWASDHKCSYLNICDANYGMFRERDKEIAEIIIKFKNETGYPQTIAATWNKNLNKDVVDIARILGSRGLTVALQSLDEKVLEEIKRTNMGVNNLTELFSLCSRENIPIYSELIIGLPYETKETWSNGHFKLMDLGQHAMLDIYLNIMIENSELNSLEQIEKHGSDIVEVDDYVSGDPKFLENGVLEKTMILRGTKYMPVDDLIESYMVSWAILTFHYFGYTQIYSRYLNQKFNISYKEFYETFFQHIKESNGIINAEYQRVRSILDTYLKTGKIQLSGKSEAGHNIFQRSLPFVTGNFRALRSELDQFVGKHFKSLFDSIQLYNDLIEFQEHFTIDYDKHYPHTLSISQDIYYTIFENDPSRDTNTKINLNIDSLVNKDNIDLKTFAERIYFTRRTNTSKAKITIIN
jgi:radical SAM superfamily enzyme YgiQ (UPF0313 family)